ncbi:MAG: efflux transporter outer membrane subunit [Verrucomicrobia bacterium]|nr:efflux transporter outer membrane subunit [Verrucomicrobiota bacterium]
MISSQRIAKVSGCIFLSGSLLAGCMFGPKYQAPVPTREPLPAVYKEVPSNTRPSGGWEIARPSDAMLRGPWWRIFHDPELDALQDQLNINNQNIKEFFQNFMEARALVAQANAQLYPTLTANASYSRSRTPPLVPISNILSVLEFSWEPDLWGKFRNALRSAQYAAQVSAGDLENERLTEQASLAIFYFQLRGQDALARVLADTIVADQKALDFNRVQYETGITDQISVVEAENTLQNAQATYTNLGIARAQFEHAIAVLIGRVASNFSIPARPLHNTPPRIPVGIPARLVQRRPDVAAAERLMASANAQIGEAFAAYFPTVTISATGGFQSHNFRTLFNASNRTWSVGPSVSETIFDAGLRTATVHQFIATYNADLFAYRQSVLTAFQQVEDALAQVRILSQQLVEQRQAEQSAEQFLKLEMVRFQTGIDPYINVVQAQNTLLSDQEAVVTVQTQQMTDSVSLIEALGGGWDVSELPTPSQVSKWPTHEESAIQH